MKHVTLPVLLGSLTILGMGCSGFSFSSYTCDQTPWGSCINQHEVDEALLGTWTLQEQSISQGGNTVVNPFSGRTTTFAIDTFEADDAGTVSYGAIFEDFSTETAESPQFQGISATCEASGGSLIPGTGTFETEQIVNLDETTDETVVVDTLLKVYGSEDPSARCTLPGGSGGTTSTSTIALGEGPGGTDALGQYAEYDYEISDDWETLIITQDRSQVGVEVMWVFTRN